jgi:hypothetical protein
MDFAMEGLLPHSYRIDLRKNLTSLLALLGAVALPLSIGGEKFAFATDHDWSELVVKDNQPH